MDLTHHVCLVVSTILSLLQVCFLAVEALAPQSHKTHAIDVCKVEEVTLTCDLGYVLTEVSKVRGEPSKCGCFKSTIDGILRQNCYGRHYCKVGYRQLKAYGNNIDYEKDLCGVVLQIQYQCEPVNPLCLSADFVNSNHYRGHINLITPNYPQSYPIVNTHAGACNMQISLVTDQSNIDAQSRLLTVTKVDTDLPGPSSYHYVLCQQNILHIGSTHKDLADRWTECHGISETFQLYSPLFVIYHVYPSDVEHRGSFLKITAPDRDQLLQLDHTGDTPGMIGHTHNPEAFRPTPPLQPDLPKILGDIISENAAVTIMEDIIPDRKPATTQQPLSKANKWLVITIIVLGVILILVLCLVLFLWKRQHLACGPLKRLDENRSMQRLDHQEGVATCNSLESLSTISPYATTDMYQGSLLSPCLEETESDIYEDLDSPSDPSWPLGKKRVGHANNSSRRSNIYDELLNPADHVTSKNSQPKMSPLINKKLKPPIGLKPNFKTQSAANCKDKDRTYLDLVSTQKTAKLLNGDNLKMGSDNVKTGSDNVKTGSKDMGTGSDDVKTGSDDAGYDSDHSSRSLILGEGETIQLENDLYQATTVL